MIKKQIFVITVFLSNIAFSATLSTETTEFFRHITITLEQNEETKNSLHEAATLHLIDKGLDPDVAKERVEIHLSHSKQEAQFLAKFLTEHAKISYNDIVAYVANAALYKQQVDLSRKDEQSALLQRSKTL